MSRLWIVVGDSTTHGGSVLNGDPILSADGKPVARIGDMVACPKCKGVFPIVSGAGNFIGSNGQLVARQGDSTACGASLVPGGQGHGVWESEAVRERASQESDVPTPTIASNPTELFDEEIQFLDPITGNPVSGLAYQIHFSDGTVLKGESCSQGLTPRATTTMPASVVKYTLGKPNGTT